MFELFKERISFVAPSEVAKDVWSMVYPEYAEKVMVIYHQKMVGEYQRNKEAKDDKQPLNVAFVGYQRPLKGWDIWYDAVTRIHKNVNYKFYQFGSVSTHLDYIEEVEVDFGKDLNSMINGLRENKIDVAVLWSLWPETYSYTFYEAMAANAFVLTNCKSGNIAYQVKKFGNGVVADSIFDLERILSDEQGLREKVTQFKIQKNNGPLELKENDELISLVDFDFGISCKRVHMELFEKVSLIYYNLLLRLYKLVKT
jgi:hypothetical protein